MFIHWLIDSTVFVEPVVHKAHTGYSRYESDMKAMDKDSTVQRGKDPSMPVTQCRVCG